MVEKSTIKRQIDEANKFSEFTNKSISDLMKLDYNEREELLQNYGKSDSVNRLIRAGIRREFEGSEDIVPISKIEEKISFSDSQILNTFRYYDEIRNRLNDEIKKRGLRVEEEEEEEEEEIEEEEEEIEEEEEEEDETPSFSDSTKILAEKLLIPSINIHVSEYEIDLNPKHFDGIKVFTEKDLNAQKYLTDINFTNYNKLINSINSFNNLNNDTIDKVRISIKLRLSDGSERYFSCKKLPPNEAIRDLSEKIQMIIERDNTYAYEISPKFEDMIRKEKNANRFQEKYIQRIIGIYYDYYRKEIEAPKSE